MTAVSRCPVCGSTDLFPVALVEGMPVFCNAFARTAQEAQAMPRGDIELVACRRCTMLYNARFDPTLAPYDSTYENSLHFSPCFQAYADELASDLARRYGTEGGGTVVEIGAGAGDFLRLVAERGFDRAVGIDPSLSSPREERAGRASLRFVNGTLADAPAGLQADLVVCRHVLEHVADPVALLRDARTELAHEGTAIYVEVPDAEHMLRTAAVWDLIYEHVGYFTGASLGAAMEAAGWRVTAGGTSFGGQYRWVEATATGEVATSDGDDQGGDRRTLVGDAERFAETYWATIARWNRFLEAETAAGRRVAAWGAGSKGVAFANSVSHRLAAIVDINERKHGRFVPGTGDAVRAPSQVAGAVDTVLVLNPLYLREAEEQGTRAGVRATYLAVE